MASSVEEFRSKNRKDLTLPSGLIVTIRRTQLWDQLGLGELVVPTGRSAPSPRGRGTEPSQPSTRTWTDRLIERGAVAPRFTADPANEDAPDALHVLDLDNADYNALAMAIMEFSGINTEVAESVNAFRSNAEREGDQSPSREVPQAAERDYESVAGGSVL